MKRENQQIIFWQETHMVREEHEKLKKLGFRNTFYSSYAKGRARGVAILISNNVAFQSSAQINDKEGRFVLVKGTLDSKEVTLLNVYRPPGRDDSFIKKIFDIIATEVSGTLICGGDWNVQLHAALDSTNPTKKMNPESIHVRKLLKDIGMFDVWRELNPSARQFTFFSHPHAVHSRVDYFFMFNAERQMIIDCSIGVRDVSDHAGVYLRLNLEVQPKNTIWRLNASLLNDNLCKEYIKKEIEEYLEFNTTEEVSPSVLWDAAKAVLRGRLIMWSARNKKKKQKQVTDLTNELKALEQRHVESHNPQILERIQSTKQRLNGILDKQVEIKLKYIKQRYYEVGPKAKKMLAWKLRKQQTERSIFKIRDPNTKVMCHTTEDIQQSFVKYYKELYSQPEAAEPSTIEHFLESLDLPSIGMEQNQLITQEITMTEIDNAISRLKTNKVPGGDGFPAEWYKTFRELLIPTLQKCFNYVLLGGKTPVSWKQAIISVIPKVGKDRTECSSYRPISVLNLDYRLFASIMAKRLEDILPDLIDTDQTGFIKNRQTQDNVRRALYLIESMSKSKTESLAISLDAEKAFDSVRWEFLYLVLQRFGFNDTVIRCLKSLYHLPTARIKINGGLSEVVNLERGCRQGCNLSPALFALFIEALAQVIREDVSITGISIKGMEHKLSLYADDVLVTLSNPKSSLPKLMTCLEEYGSYSGYKVNINKTQTLSFNYLPQENVRRKFNFKWNADVIKYLGVNIPKKLTDIYNVNYNPITREIKTDLDRWVPLTLSMYDRIETIKMNILPRLLFFFQSLPVEIPKKQFDEWNRLISRFVWRGQKPRVRFSTLQLPKEQGGMSLPCLEDYYKAAQLRYLVCWCSCDYNAKWKDIELSQLDVPLQSVLGDTTSKIVQSDELSNWTRVALNIWFKECKNSKLGRDARLLRWVAYDRDFKPGQLDSRFKQWIRKGITSYSTISSSAGLRSFQYLIDNHNLEKQDFYRYLQLRHHFDRDIKNNKGTEMSLISIFIEAYKGSTHKKLVSRIYSKLQSNRNHSTLYVRDRWEKEANIVLTEEEWLDICEIQSTTSSSGQWREFAWKNTMRFFITPRRTYLQSGRPGAGSCWRECNNSMADHYHIFWGCPAIQSYWLGIVSEINLIMEFEVECSFNTVYLGNIPTTFNTQDKYLLKILLVASKKAITKKWLNKNPPTKEEWITIVKGVFEMERLTFSLRLCTDKFYKYWSKWLVYAKVDTTSFPIV